MQNFIWSNQISQKNSLCTRSPLELFLGQHNTFSSYIKLPSQLRYDFVIYTLWWSFSSWNTSTASMILRHLFAIQINTFNAQSFHNTLQSDYLVAELVRLGWHHWCFVCVSSSCLTICGVQIRFDDVFSLLWRCFLNTCTVSFQFSHHCKY